MNHCYIIDYDTSSIYHTKLPDNLNDSKEIEDYLYRTLGFKSTSMYYMITSNELDIIEL